MSEPTKPDVKPDDLTEDALDKVSGGHGILPGGPPGSSLESGIPSKTEAGNPLLGTHSKTLL